MKNNIVINQNKDENLVLRVKINKLYANVKKYIRVQWIVLVIIGVLYLSYALSPFFQSNSNLLFLPYFSWWAPFLSIIFTIIDTIYLIPKMNKINKKAAIINDYFDTIVLELPFNKIKIDKIYSLSSLDIIEEEIIKFKDWYDPFISNVPLDVGRIIAQKSNCIWDFELRDYFIKLLAILFLFCIVTLVVIILFINTSMDVFLKGLFSFFYFVNFFVRYYYSNINSKNRISKLDYKIDEIWENNVLNKDSVENLEFLSRQFQDELYDHRKNIMLIPEWFYIKEKDSQKEKSKKIIENMVFEYLECYSY